MNLVPPLHQYNKIKQKINLKCPTTNQTKRKYMKLQNTQLYVPFHLPSPFQWVCFGFRNMETSHNLKTRTTTLQESFSDTTLDKQSKFLVMTTKQKQTKMEVLHL